MKQSILDFIKDHDKSCGDDFGVNPALIKYGLKLEDEPLNQALNELYKEKKIIVRDAPGVGKIIFYNYE